MKTITSNGFIRLLQLPGLFSNHARTPVLSSPPRRAGWARPLVLVTKVGQSMAKQPWAKDRLDPLQTLGY